MEKTLESVQRNFSTVRTGRANPSMLDRIDVDYYGVQTPLNQMAGISAPEASLLVVQPYDPSAIPAIERAIQQSDIGLNPNNDGKLIRLVIPQLTAVRPAPGGGSAPASPTSPPAPCPRLLGRPAPVVGRPRPHFFDCIRPPPGAPPACRTAARR